MASTLKIEDAYVDRGYPCFVVFQKHGIRCGYVGVPERHWLYGQRYGYIDFLYEDSAYDFPYIHGGLTYSGQDLQTVPPEFDDKGYWWVGFDCNHYNDIPDVETLRELLDPKEFEEFMEFNRYLNCASLGTVKTLLFVKHELKKLVDFLVKEDKKNAGKGH